MSEAFSFLHAADLHLDSPLRGLEADAPAERIRGATRQALVNLVDLALRERVRFVLLAGDLFDGDWEDWPTGHFLVGQLGRLTRVGIPVYAISGNHDAASVLTRRLPWPEGATLFATDAAHSLHVPGLPVVIHGQGFATRAVNDNLAKDFPKPVAGKLNIGLLHTACNTGEQENYAPCTPEQLVAHGYDYWALGHIHARRQLSGHPSWVVFPGNTQGRHANETGDKGVTLVRVAEGRMTPEHHPVDALRWMRLRVDLDGCCDADEMSARVRAALREAAEQAGERMVAARVELHGATSLHAALVTDNTATREGVRAEVLGLGLDDHMWIEKVVVATRPVADLADLEQGSDGWATLLGALRAEPSAAVTDDVTRYALRLLDRVPRLRETLGADHPAVRSVSGNLPPELIARARALLLARLEAG